MHVESSQIPSPKPGQTIEHRVKLAKGDTAWMPGTTKNVWHGPACLLYLVHPDGGVDCRKEK